MTEKRFDVSNLKIQDNAPKGRLYLLDMQGGVNALCSLINGLNDKSNRLEKENEQLKQQLNDITLNWTQNKNEFDKDELYVKDNNTEINLKNRNLHISVFIPQIKEYFRFNYIVTGRSLEREYNTLKGDDGI